eukprot:TRINITY_DN4547_c0_g1_i1.p1 TRINITY_DN4547_c0_g1~~TRINITY_DN4547_c0_g1_i1.p1  ORF type:complete len:169 (-),score=37.28 TRINITY_DN4547_c0_g1_i1:87-593(-)
MDDGVSTTMNLRAEFIGDSAADHTTEGARQQDPAVPEALSRLPSEYAQHGRSEAVDGNQAEPSVNGEMAGASLEAAKGGPEAGNFPKAALHVKGNSERRTEEGKRVQSLAGKEELQSIRNSLGEAVDREAEERCIDAIRAVEEVEGVKQSQLEKYNSWLEKDGEESST